MTAFKLGDVVMVYRPTKCCNAVVDIGKIFTINNIEHANGIPAVCCTCGDKTDVDLYSDGGIYLMFEAYELKLIPPLDELEDITLNLELELCTVN